MSIRFLKLSLASPESIRSWTERILPNGKRVGKILKGDLIDYKNGLPIRDGLSCERIFGPMVSFTCTCGRFKCIETRGIHIVHDTLRSSRLIVPDVSGQTSNLKVKQWGEIERPFQTSSNSTRLEMNTLANPTVSQNTIYKGSLRGPANKLVYNGVSYNSKSNQKSFPSASVSKNRFRNTETKSFESLVLQPYTQKKMIRFLSDFYYDYQYIYHSNKNEMIPSFISIFEEPYNITLTKQFSIAIDSYKPKTLDEHSQKWESFKLSRPCGEFFPMVNNQTRGLKIHSSILQNLLKPLYKLLFQIYAKFWFDLKFYSRGATEYSPSGGDFIYEKHIFLWVPNSKLKTQKTMLAFKASKNKRSQVFNSKRNLKIRELYHKFKVHATFFNKFSIRGLFDKNSKLPIIGKILPYQTSLLSSGNLNQSCVMQNHNNGTVPFNIMLKEHKYLGFSNLSLFLLTLRQWPENFFQQRVARGYQRSSYGANGKTIPNNALLLLKEKPFFLVARKIKKVPNSWYSVSISQNRSCIKFLSNTNGAALNFKFYPRGSKMVGDNFLGIPFLGNTKKETRCLNSNNSFKQGSKLIQYYNSQIWRPFTPKIQNLPKIKKNTFPFRFTAILWLRITSNFQKDMFLNKIPIYWSQLNYKFELPYIFQQSMKLKLEKTTESYLFKSLHIIALYFAVSPKFYLSIPKQTSPLNIEIERRGSRVFNFPSPENTAAKVAGLTRKLACNPNEKRKINRGCFAGRNQKLRGHFAGLEINNPVVPIKNTLPTVFFNYYLASDLYSTNTKDLFEKENGSVYIPNEISLLVNKSLVLNMIKSKKIANISFGSLKMKSFNFRKELAGADIFPRLLSALKTGDSDLRSMASTVFNPSAFSNTENTDGLLSNKTNKGSLRGLAKKYPPGRKSTPEKEPGVAPQVSIFDFFKKQEIIKMALLTSNQKASSTKNPFSNSEKKERVSPLNSWTQTSEIQETFSPKGEDPASRVQIAPLGLTTDSHNEDVSKPYLGSNTKQNIRVYKFKNFPPEEIRYCPYCEVELLPNSIRRYRLGYIEFVSPVTHIWYTASSIPLLLNLSKTMIEGIASCHEALSSGFPPVYKWSYNGESPTSWTFQMQPLKLPINVVPKRVSSGKHTIKKSYYREIISPKGLQRVVKKAAISLGGFNAITCLNSRRGEKPPTGAKIWTPSFQIIPRELIESPAGADFIMYQKRIKGPFKKNQKGNGKEAMDKTKKNEFKVPLRVYNKNSWFENPSTKMPLHVSNFTDTLEATHTFLNKPSLRGEETIENQLQGSLSRGENYLKKSSLGAAFYATEPRGRFAGKKITNFKRPVLYTRGATPNLSIMLNSSAGADLNPRWITATGFLNQKKIVFPFDQDFKRASFISNKKGRLYFYCYKNIEIIKNQKISALNITNEIMRGFPFFTQIPKKIDSHYDPFTATEYEKKREWLKLEGFFEDFSNSKLANNSHEPRRGELENSKGNTSFVDLDKQNKLNESVQRKLQEDDYLNQKHLKSRNEIPEKNEDDDSFVDNISLPLVLPFLGKNPDNIEFKSNYSNHEHFHIDPLKFIIDLYSTQHIWGHTSSDVNSHKQSNEFETSQNRDLTKSPASADISPPMVNFNLKKQTEPHRVAPSTQSNGHALGKHIFRERWLEKIPYHKFFGITSGHLGYVGNNTWNNVSITNNGPMTEWSNKNMFIDLSTNQIVQKTDNLQSVNKLRSKMGFPRPIPFNPLKVQTSDLLNELQSSFSLFFSRGAISYQQNQENNFWSLLNPFYIISNNLFSKTHPFLPVDLNWTFYNSKARINPSEKEMIVSKGSEISRIQNIGFSAGFRKLGRNLYYFKLEQMARSLENRFLKNLFHRNKFYKTLVLKENLLVLPLTGSSIFYFHPCRDHSNKIGFKNKGSNRGNGDFSGQNFTMAKTTHFLRNNPPREQSLFGFYLNLSSFNDWSSYLAKIKYSPFLEIRKSRFFSGIMIDKFPYSIPSIRIPIPFFSSKKNRKDSLWPLKSNIKNSYKKVYVNNFNETFYENIEKIHQLWPYWKGISLATPFKNNFLNEKQAPVFSPVGKIQMRPSFLAGKKTGAKSINKIQTRRATPAGATLTFFNAFLFFKNPQKSKVSCFKNMFLKQEIEPGFFTKNKQVSELCFLTPNFQEECKTKQSNLMYKTFPTNTIVGMPISIVYDFVISRSFFLMKNLPSASQFESTLNQNISLRSHHKVKMLETKRLKKIPLPRGVASRENLKEWAQNKYFPAVYFNNLLTDKSFEDKWLQINYALKIMRQHHQNPFTKWSKQENKIKTVTNKSYKGNFQATRHLNFKKRYFMPLRTSRERGFYKKNSPQGRTNTIILNRLLKKLLSLKRVEDYQAYRKVLVPFLQPDGINIQMPKLVRPKIELKPFFSRGAAPKKEDKPTKKPWLFDLIRPLKLTNKFLGFSGKTRAAKPQFDSLALLGFDTTQIEFFGSLKIYAKRKFLEIYSPKDENLKNKIPLWLNHKQSYKYLSDSSSKIQDLSNQKCVSIKKTSILNTNTRLQPLVGARWDFHFQPLATLWGKKKSMLQASEFDTYFKHNRVIFSKRFKNVMLNWKKKQTSNPNLKNWTRQASSHAFLISSHLNTIDGTLNSLLTNSERKKKTSTDNCFTPPISIYGSKKSKISGRSAGSNFSECLNLYQNQQKAPQERILPWKKNSPYPTNRPLKNVILTKIKGHVYFPIIKLKMVLAGKSSLFNNGYHLNTLRLSKLILQPQSVSDLRHKCVKHHKNTVCYAYAIETIQNKKQGSLSQKVTPRAFYSISPFESASRLKNDFKHKSVFDLKNQIEKDQNPLQLLGGSESPNSNYIPSLSSKISCFFYFGHSPIDLLNFRNKSIIQKNSSSGIFINKNTAAAVFFINKKHGCFNRFPISKTINPNKTDSRKIIEQKISKQILLLESVNFNSFCLSSKLSKNSSVFKFSNTNLQKPLLAERPLEKPVFQGSRREVKNTKTINYFDIKSKSDFQISIINSKVKYSSVLLEEKILPFFLIRGRKRVFNQKSATARIQKQELACLQDVGLKKKGRSRGESLRGKNLKTPIPQWGRRGHIFNRLTFYKNHNDNHKNPYEFIKPRGTTPNNIKNTRRAGSEFLSKTNNNYSLANWRSEKLNQKLLAYYYNPLIDEKSKSDTIQNNTNYYACISQITSWGSDHGSWILFLKYIRANIYKGDQLLPLYFNKMNFQMMPRTGSIMLQQLLSQLTLIPKAEKRSSLQTRKSERDFIEKEKSTSEIDTWRNTTRGPYFFTNNHKHSDRISHKSIKKIRGMGSNQNSIQGGITNRYFHYSSSFLFNQAPLVISHLNKQWSGIQAKFDHKQPTFRFLKMKHNNIYSNKSILYAYKIKKPVSHKRFRQISQTSSVLGKTQGWNESGLNSPKLINNWYRLNNFFSYSQPSIQQVKSHAATSHGSGICLDKSFESKQGVPVLVSTKTAMIGNDIRILKLIYGLIISFQNSFLPINRQTKQYTNRFQNQKKLFNTPFYPHVRSSSKKSSQGHEKKFEAALRVNNKTSKAIDWYPTYKTSNTYYHIYSNKSNDLKPEWCYLKSSISDLSTKISFKITKTTDLNGYYDSVFDNSKLLHLYSLKSKAISRLFNVELCLLKNHHFSFLPSLITKIDNHREHPLNKISKLHSNQNLHQRVARDFKSSKHIVPQENFYFSNQKRKIYNILISPLEVPTFQFLNFGFSTTPFDFIKSESNRFSLKSNSNPRIGRKNSRKERNRSIELLKTQAKIGYRPVTDFAHRVASKTQHDAAWPSTDFQAKRSNKKSCEWFYSKQINRSISNIKSFPNIIYNHDFNQNNNRAEGSLRGGGNQLSIFEKVTLRNSQINKFTNGSLYENKNPAEADLFQVGCKSTLPMNFKTYKGEIKGETLFIKLKEVGNHNVLMKKKNTVFKTLILKMNSSLQPLLSSSFQRNPRPCGDFKNQIDHTFRLKKLEIAPRVNFDKNQTKLIKGINIPTKQPKIWNQNLGFGKENLFNFYNQHLIVNSQQHHNNTSLPESQTGLLNPKELSTRESLVALGAKKYSNQTQATANSNLSIAFNELKFSPARYIPNKGVASRVRKPVNQNYKMLIYPTRNRPEVNTKNTTASVFSPCRKTGILLNTDASEFFRIWLFLDSVHYSHLHGFNNIQNQGLLRRCKFDPTVITKKLLLNQECRTEKLSNKDFFSKILQFYEYRKNFLLKKIFKERLSLTQFNVCINSFNTYHKPIKVWPIAKLQFKAVALPKKKKSILGFSESHLRFNKFHFPIAGKRPDFFDRLGLICSFSQLPLSIRYFTLLFLQNNKRSLRGSFKICFGTYTLLKRRINIFYDQESDLNIKYEFKPFGPQIRHRSTYNNWKNSAPVRSFKPSQEQSFDLRNTNFAVFKNQTRFRLLTIPEIFDFKEQSNSLNIIPKNETVINYLGPLFFSSRIRPSEKNRTFSILNAPKSRPFWNTHNRVGQDFENLESGSTDLETFNSNRPLSSETLFREENLKVSSSYKALLRKAKILEDYPVPNPDPIDLNSTCLRLLNCGLPRPIWWNLQTTPLGEKFSKLPLFRDAFNYDNKQNNYPYFYKNTKTNKVNKPNSPLRGNSPAGANKTLTKADLVSRLIWDGNQNRFKNWMASKDKLEVTPQIDNSTTDHGIKTSVRVRSTDGRSTGEDVFSMRDWTKLENNTISNINDGSKLSFFGQNGYSDSKNIVYEPTTRREPEMKLVPPLRSDFFSNHGENSRVTKSQGISLKKKNRFKGSQANSSSELLGNSKSSRRSGTINYTRNLRKLRLQYLRNFRRLRFIEYLKATYIKPEWMILSLLPVLPPDLRPVIANPRGYITGDINTHYQNVIYRNNNIEKLLDTFWIPKKFYNKISFFNHQKDTRLMLSSMESYLNSIYFLPTYKTKLLKFKNSDPIFQSFLKSMLIPLTFLSENEIKKTPIQNNEWFNSFIETDSPSIYPSSIAKAFRESKIQRDTGFDLNESIFHNIHYKPLLKLYNQWSFFGSNIGIATGYNKMVQAHQFKQLDNDNELAFEQSSIPTAVSRELKENAVPSLEAKIIRTQALHDSKPLQEMQYSLQKAVDALIDNSQKLQSNVLLRKGRPLKSLSDNLKGKEGRFRQHLLGKRVDYSGRSVIVVGPDLKLYECGIPLIMALRLFQPFLILYLIYRFKIASLLATQLIQRKHPMVINLLKKFIETWPILLNRAPTLHRMNIQAFKIRLVQGKAILLHPLVCSSYNADFDGDQMGVHVPITQQARAESWKLLWSINNSIGLASRQPLFLPSQDMVIGNYYLTAPPIENNLASLIPKKSSPLSAYTEPPKTVAVIGPILSSRREGLTRFSYFDQQSLNGFSKIDHSFFSLDEAYQYYLNTAYRFHVNTPVWFYFGMVFETSEREKAIEITIDKHANNKIITKYYEKQFKRNRILGKNRFSFNSDLNFPITKTMLKDKPVKPPQKHIYESSVQKPSQGRTNIKFYPFSNIDKTRILPSQTRFNRNLNPILLKQIIRSTFGRIEFYYEAFNVSSSESPQGRKTN